MLRCRSSLRRVAPTRAAASWHELGNFALKDSDQAAFRDARNRAATVEGVVANAKSGKDLKINWAEWESSIKHKEIVSCLKDFHTKQMQLLQSVSGEDHKKAVESQSSGWDLYEKSVVSCETSVQASKTLVQNGATALWISFHNPPISHASQNEWLDTDQYWQAFVEKHHYYHNHINSATEDPESLEYDAKIEADNLFMWERFDGRGVSRFNNKLMSSKPTYEYYDCFRGKLVEHMIYYLAKTGGDARFFPELMSFDQFNELYAKRNQVYNVLQRRRRIEQEAAVAQETALNGLPADMEHDGEAFALKTIARENVALEFTVARLMGNYMFLSEPYIPVQTRLGMYRALASDGGQGKFYSFGDDVNALFYKTADSALPSPSAGFHSFLNHLNLSGKRLPVWYNCLSEVFVELVESRKAVTGGNWFTAPEESQADAFMRRVSKFDPSRGIYQCYVDELKERMAGATEVDANAKIDAIESQYREECDAYQAVLFGLNEETTAQAKASGEKFAKLEDEGQLQSLLDSGGVVALDASGARVTSAEQLKAASEEYEAVRDKIVESVMNTKTSCDTKLKK